MAGSSSSNAATKAFFKSGYGIMLAVYDTRRGQQDGREAEKILAFYPPTAPDVMQSSIVGLAQALTMFAGVHAVLCCCCCCAVGGSMRRDAVCCTGLEVLLCAVCCAAARHGTPFEKHPW